MIDEMSDEPIDKVTMCWKQIEKFLETIMNADVRALCGVSAATANRILSEFSSEGKLIKYREGGHWAYMLYQPSLWNDFRPISFRVPTELKS